MPSATNKNEATVVEVDPPVELEATHITFSFVLTFLLKHIVSLLEPLARLWINYHRRIFGEQMVIMDAASPLNFIITSLYVFAEIKSQGSEFPFQTHPVSMTVVVTSLLLYGLASAAEHFISVTHDLGPASVYAIIARLGRICCLCILMASLASLFYLK